MSTSTSTQSDPHEGKHLEPSARMREKFFRELAVVQLSTADVEPRVVTEADLQPLPGAAQRYLRFMRVLGRPRDVSFRAHWEGNFRMSPHQGWTPCEVWQYNTSLDVARIFHMRLNVSGIVPTYVRDLYVHGGGHMAGKILDRFKVVDDASEKITIGELATYLDDALLFAPSMLLGAKTRWEAVDDGSFDVSFTDWQHTVKARGHVDADGAILNISTEDRFGQDPANRKAGLVRTEWTTPVDGWECVGDRMRPRSAQAIWHYPSGDFAYAQISSTGMELAYDVPSR